MSSPSPFGALPPFRDESLLCTATATAAASLSALLQSVGLDASLLPSQEEDDQLPPMPEPDQPAPTPARMWFADSLPPCVAAALASRRRWTFDVFGLARAIEEARASSREPLLGPLATLALALIDDLGLCTALAIEEDALCSFMRSVEALYASRPYHNALHAACVVHAASFLLTTAGDGLLARLRPVEALALVLAAAVHDVGHPGVANGFLVASGAPVALHFSSSVLENYHAETACRLLDLPESRLDANMGASDAVLFRQLLVSLVLATDAEQHDKQLAQLRLQSTPLDMDRSDDRLLLLKFCLQLCDISSSCQPLATSLRWAVAINAEFAFQSECEQRLGLPVTNASRSLVASQIAFIDSKAVPVFSAAARLLPSFGMPAHARLLCNRAWLARQLTRSSDDGKATTPAPA
jgi:hypothetical protein